MLTKTRLLVFLTLAALLELLVVSGEGALGGPLQSPAIRTALRTTTPQTQASSAAVYETTGVAFDGSTDCAEKGTADLTGLADGTTGTVSVWFRVDGGAGNYRMIMDTSSNLVGFYLTNGNKFEVIFYSAGFAVQIINYPSTSTFAADGTWHHVMVSGNGTAINAYVDGAGPDLGASTNSGTIDYANGSHIYTIGCRSGGSLLFNGALADVYFTNEYIDLSDAGARAKFISGGKPVDLGATGTLPTGTAPKVLLRASPTHGEAVNAFHTNKGTGGGFTLTGTLAAAATDPTD